MTRWAVVLAGGSGTRFWPLSTPSRPKQFLRLAGDAPLLTQTIARLHTVVPPERVLIVTNARYVAPTRQMLPTVPSDNVLGEPRAASTGPALTWATAEIRRRDRTASVLSLHADWHVEDISGFRRVATRALEVAERFDVLVTVGIVPTRPEIGYGYVVPGAMLDGDTRQVARFVEKPAAEEAQRLIGTGALWNSGLFAWTTDRFLAETEALSPEIAPHVTRLERDDVAGFFAAVTPIAVDHSHFERSHRVAVVPGDFGWDDVGTWAALTRVRSIDPSGNVVVGGATLRDAADCVVWADDGPVVVDGLRDAVVVRAHGVTLVTTRARAADLKSLLETLPLPLHEPKE